MQNGKKAEPYRHVLNIDHQQEALWGIPTLIPRWIPIFGTIAVKVLLGLISFYVEWPIIGTALLISSVWAMAFIWLVRRHRMAWMKSDEELHRLTHELRDHLDAILRCEDKSNLALKVAHCEKEIANAIAKYFSRRLHNDSCGCCIRLASLHDGKPAYLTRGRSNTLGVGRQQTSEPIYEDSNFIRMLKKGDSLGVWLLNDLELAIESMIWPDMRNNKLHEFDSVMIAPINTVIDGRKTMAGILFVTAKRRTFQPAHTTAVKSFADQIGAIVPLLYNEKVPVLPSVNNVPISDSKIQRSEP